MYHHASGACPRCQQVISAARKQGGVVICDNCGFVLSSSEATAHEDSRKRFVHFVIGLSSVFFGFIWVSMWDSYALEVIPLKIRELMGTSSLNDLQKMAHICLERHKVECAENAYMKMGDKDAKQLIVLGEFQMSKRRYTEAVNTYRVFFTKGGKDLKASYQFARALEETGKKDEAAKYYKYILSSRPDSLLQSATVHSYVKLLRAVHPDQVHRAIEDVRRHSKVSAYLMDEEFKNGGVYGDPAAAHRQSLASAAPARTIASAAPAHKKKERR